MNKAVIGLGFGDEGKGLFVDYLASKSPNSMVVRFSGGHQCSHTVVKDGVSHVFANFGSGSLRGRPTYWSKFCTVEPIGLINELYQLRNKGCEPVLYIDGQCPITTPYDIFNDRKTGRNKGICRSCGVGYGDTIKREADFYHFTFSDLFYPDVVKEKLKNIQQYYYDFGSADMKDFMICCDRLAGMENIELVDRRPSRYEDYIFEGSQGLLLDQHFGFFPNVTRSNIGTKNIFEILQGDMLSEVYFITRAYQTRHGEGFMSTEDLPHNIVDNVLETNKENVYQGKFRKGILDVSLLEYAINKDAQFGRLCKNLVITCLDHIVNDCRFLYKKEIQSCDDVDDFVSRVSSLLDIRDVYLSRGSDSKNIIKWEGR